MFNKAVTDKFKSYGRNARDNLPINYSGSTRDSLASLFGAIGFNVGAEIGVRSGRFSRVLCKANPKLHLFCVDPWAAYSRLTQEKQDAYYADAVNNLKDYNVTFVRKYSMDALADFEDGSLDFVYIDGNHEFDFCCPDIIFWAKKVKQGGAMAVHDYYPFYRAGVVQAVNAYVSAHNISPWFVTRERESTAYWENP
jgi:predicted O-methyltransferase YrrM